MKRIGLLLSIICFFLATSGKCQDDRSYYVQANSGIQFIKLKNTFATPFLYDGMGWRSGFFLGIENRWNKQLKVEMGSGRALSDDGEDLFNINHLDLREIHVSFGVSRHFVKTDKFSLSIVLALAMQTHLMDFEVENVLRPVQINDQQRFSFVGVGATIVNSYKLLPALAVEFSLEAFPATFSNYPSPTNPDLNLNNESKIQGMRDNYYLSAIGGLEYLLTEKWSLSLSSHYQRRRFIDVYELTSTIWINNLGVNYRWK